MTLVGVAFLVLRMFSVILFYLGITNLMKFYYLGLTSWQVVELEFDIRAMALIHVIPALIMLAMGAVLWIYAGKFSSLFVPKDSTRNLQNDLSFKISYNALISLVGLVIVIFSVANLCRDIPQYLLQNTYAYNPLNTQYLFNALAELIKLLLGVFLIVKANVISGIFEFLQKRQSEMKSIDNE